MAQQDYSPVSDEEIQNSYLNKLRGISPVQDNSPQVAPVQDSLQSYRNTIYQEPQRENYEPSRWRRLAAAIAGGLAGVGHPELGVQTAQGITGAPYNTAMGEYQSQLSRIKNLSDFDQAQINAQGERGLTAAKTAEQQAQKIAEDRRAEAESANQQRQLKEANALPGSFTEAQAGKESIAKIEHPEKDSNPYDVKVENGVAVVHNKQTGEIHFVHDPDTVASIEKLTGDAKNGDVAREMLSHPEKYSASQLTNAKAILDKEKATLDNIKSQIGNRGVTYIVNPSTNTVEPARSGSTLPENYTTVQQGGQENVTEDKKVQAERDAQKKAASAYTQAKQLANQNTGPADAAFLLHFIGVANSAQLQKPRLSKTEQDYFENTRSSLGDLDALRLKIGTGGRLTTEQKTQMLKTMAILGNVDEGPSNAPAVTHRYNPQTKKIEEVK